jgi:hypothetical protein
MSTYAPKKKRRKVDYLTYGAYKNQPLTIKKSDGTIIVEERKTPKELRTIIRKGHKNRLK